MEDYSLAKVSGPVSGPFEDSEGIDSLAEIAYNKYLRVAG